MPRLLIVEDDPKIIDSVTKALSLEEGFSVRPTSDPESAVAAAVEFRPDIILLDIRLPGGDGRQVLKRLKANPATRGGLIHAGPLRLDPSSRRVFVGKEELSLQPKEFEVLYLLARHPGKTLSRAFLIENTSSYGSEVETRSLDTHIKNLRKKLKADAWWIRTVQRMGYLFSQDAPPADA